MRQPGPSCPTRCLRVRRLRRRRGQRLRGGRELALHLRRLPVRQRRTGRRRPLRRRLPVQTTRRQRYLRGQAVHRHCLRPRLWPAGRRLPGTGVRLRVSQWPTATRLGWGGLPCWPPSRGGPAAGALEGPQLEERRPKPQTEPRPGVEQTQPVRGETARQFFCPPWLGTVCSRSLPPTPLASSLK